jgi:hypothetical protein
MDAQPQDIDATGIEDFAGNTPLWPAYAEKRSSLRSASAEQASAQAGMPRNLKFLLRKRLWLWAMINC